MNFSGDFVSMIKERLNQFKELVLLEEHNDSLVYAVNGDENCTIIVWWVASDEFIAVNGDFGSSVKSLGFYSLAQLCELMPWLIDCVTKL